MALLFFKRLGWMTKDENEKKSCSAESIDSKNVSFTVFDADAEEAQFCSAVSGLSEPKTAENEYDCRRRLLREANEGSVTAMVMYARMLSEGRGGTRDEASARDWFLRAANRGNAEAMYYAGRSLMNALGGPIDVRKSMNWLKKAAKAGYPDAVRHLAKLEQRNGGNGNGK